MQGITDIWTDDAGTCCVHAQAPQHHRSKPTIANCMHMQLRAGMRATLPLGAGGAKASRAAARAGGGGGGQGGA